MTAILSISRAVVAFVAAAGFLFGQLFSGTFTLGASLAGFMGIAACALSLLSEGKPLLSGFLLVCCAASVAGVGLDVWRYYTELDSPGNYYAWFLVGPYLVALAVIAQAAWVQRAKPLV